MADIFEAQMVPILEACSGIRPVGVFREQRQLLRAAATLTRGLALLRSVGRNHRLMPDRRFTLAASGSHMGGCSAQTQSKKSRTGDKTQASPHVSAVSAFTRGDHPASSK